MDSKACFVEGCDKPSRQSRVPVCEMHYYRFRRTGMYDLRPRPPKRIPEAKQPRRTRTVCVVEGCDKIDCGPHGYCKKHEARVLRHGDPSVCIPQRERALPRGEQHWSWSGEAASYTAVHQRLKRSRGLASRQLCQSCGGQARQWSYDRTDPEERYDDGRPYSTDLTRYRPLCVSCHKRFDLAAIGVASA